MEITRILSQPYYIVNIFLTATFLYIREKHLNKSKLASIDTLGYSTETTLLAIFSIIIAVKCRQSFSFEHAINTTLYYLKILIIVLSGIAGNYTVIAYYLLAFLIVWFAFEIPSYTGPSKFVELTAAEFTAILSADRQANEKARDRFIFAYFYADFASTCALVG